MAENSKPSHNPHAKRLLASVESAQGIDKLIAIMAALRDPQGGCAWDRAQDYKSILPFTIEEVYEVAEAIETADFEHLPGELGDLLFQVVFYARIAEEEGRFDFNDIIDQICDKLVRRHPHVFAEANYQDEAALKQAWESAKAEERSQRPGLKNHQESSILTDIPRALPELKRAQKIQKRVANVGFDWERVEQVWDKVEEEMVEIREAAASGNQAHLQEEIGDLLFAMVNLSRHYGVDADIALREANQKFCQRFELVEAAATKPLDEYDLAGLEDLWLLAKAKNSLND